MKKVFALYVLGLVIAQVLPKESEGGTANKSESSTKSESQASVKVNRTTYIKIHDDKDSSKEGCKKFCLKDKKFICCPPVDEGKKDKNGDI